MFYWLLSLKIIRGFFIFYINEIDKIFNVRIVAKKCVFFGTFVDSGQALSATPLGERK